MTKSVDILVVGGGIIGLMSAFYAARSGARVTLAEQHFPGTQEGSSAEHVRMWRTMYNEIEFSEMAFQSGSLYTEIESQAGVKLLHYHGLLNFGSETDYTPEGTLLDPIQTLNSMNKTYKLLDKKEIEKQYPFKNLPDHYVGIFQPDNAVIDVKTTINTAINLCKSHGVNFLSRKKLLKIDNNFSGVKSTFEDGDVIHSRKIILAMGPYTNEVLKPSFDIELNLLFWDMCFSYYRLDGSIENYPMWFQFDKPHNGYSSLFYGFPEVEFARPGFCRIAVDWASHTFSDIAQRYYAPPRIDIEIVRNFVKDHIIGLDSAPVDVGRAVMAHFPDNGCLLDFLPKNFPHYQNVVVCAAGWAFKFAPLFGKICADLALEKNEFKHNISTLSIDRPQRILSKPRLIDIAKFMH